MVVTESVEEGGMLSADVGQRLDDGCIRPCAFDMGCSSATHPEPKLLGPSRYGVEERGLSHAGHTGYEQHPALAARRIHQRMLGDRFLPRPSDQAVGSHGDEIVLLQQAVAKGGRLP